MAKRKPTDPSAQPALIHPHAVYSVQALMTALGIPRSCIGREVRLGRLRMSRRAGKYYCVGEWLLEWLRSGEIKPRRRTEARVESNGRT